MSMSRNHPYSFSICWIQPSAMSVDDDFLYKRRY